MELQRRLATRKVSVCPSFRPSVCLLNACIVTKRKKKICPDFYTIRMIIYPSFLMRRMVGGGDPFYVNFFGSSWPRWSENTDFQSIFARSASAVAPSIKSSLNTNRKSTYAHSSEPKINIVRYSSPPPKKRGGVKNASKIALCLKRVGYKVSSCEECQRQSCKAFAH